MEIMNIDDPPLKPPCCMHILVHIVRLSCIIDLARTNLVLVWIYLRASRYASFCTWRWNGSLPRCKTCKVFVCFVAIVRIRVYYVDLFSLFYVTGECHRFLHRG